MKIKSGTEELIAKYLLGDITEHEKKQLDNWIKTSPQHEEFFNRLRTSASFRKRYEAYTQINSHQAWKHFKKKYCQVSVTSILLKYAAILILPIIITAGGWYFYTASEKQISDNLTLGDAIQPGIPKATLILAGNDKQSLTPTYPTPVKVNHSTTAIAQNGALIYPSTPNINIDIPQKQQPEIVEKKKHINN